VKTIILTAQELTLAIRALAVGGLVAFPTETVYGLGADGLNEAACQQIFFAKGRPADNPLILHVLDRVGLEPLVNGPLPEMAERLIDAFWPGPLTVVIPSQAIVPSSVRAGLDTVAVRAPNHPVARALIAGLGRPIAAPSANVSGRPSPTSAGVVWEDLRGRIPYIVDGGDTTVGVESAVVDCTTDPVTLLRPGGLSVERIQAVVGDVQQANGEGPARAPGMKYRHYAPRAPLIWIDSLDPLAATLTIRNLHHQYPTIGVIAPDSLPRLPGVIYESLGPDDTSAAHRLFNAIRTVDKAAPHVIVVVWGSHDGLGLAVQNRIAKAASSRIVP